ncbi:unnamed protein product, partial [Ixodes hexagonus]
LESHFIPGKNGCVVNFPSVQRPTPGNPGTSLEEADRLLASIASPESMLLCFSLSLATFQFSGHKAKGPGDPCTAVIKTSFQEVSSLTNGSWSPVMVSETAQSSYRRGMGLIQTFDTPEDIRRKASLFPAYSVPDVPCVAFYDIEFDECLGFCEDMERSRRFRTSLKPYGKVNGVVCLHVRSVSSTLTGPKSPIIINLNICLLAGTNKLVCTIQHVPEGTLPEHVSPCDYLVYMSITREGEDGTLVPQNDDDFGTFLGLSNGSAPKLALELKSAELLAPEANTSIEEAAMVMQFGLFRHLISAVALFVDKDHYNKSHQDKLLILVKTYRAFPAANAGNWPAMELILGVPPTTDDSGVELLEYVDVLILLVHHVSPNKHCRVVFPSTGTNGETFTELEHSLLKDLPSTLRRQHTICVSISLAVLEFSSFGQPVKPGDDCDAETWKPYHETCPRQNFLPTCDAESMSDIEQDDSFTRTYETEDSLYMKVANIEAVFGETSCVAAFHLEYEDAGSVCENRTAFSRVAAISRAFTIGNRSQTEAGLPGNRPQTETDLPGNHSQAETGLPGNRSETKTGLPGLLICVWSEDPPVVMKVPSGICNIMVYKYVQYNRVTDFLQLKTDYLFEEFTAQGKEDATLKLFVAFDHTSFEDPWFREGSFAKRFSVAASVWVERMGLHGVAFFSQTFGFLLRVFPVLQALRNQTVWRPAVLLGMPVTDDADTLEQFARRYMNVDIIVFMTHHPEPSKPCVVTFPSSQVRRIDSSALLKRLSGLSHAMHKRYGNLQSVCYAANLAVLKFKLKPKQSALDDSCFREEWLTYSEVCSWGGTVQYDSLASAVTLRKQNLMLFFDTVYSLKTKVRRLLGS